MSDLTFQSPLMLLLLPVAVAPAVLPYLWRQRMGPVTMSYADTELLPGTRRSLRLRLMPLVSMLRYLALALVIVGLHWRNILRLIKGEEARLPNVFHRRSFTTS